MKEILERNRTSAAAAAKNEKISAEAESFTSLKASWDNMVLEVGGLSPTTPSNPEQPSFISSLDASSPFQSSPDKVKNQAQSYQQQQQQQQSQQRYHKKESHAATYNFDESKDDSFEISAADFEVHKLSSNISSANLILQCII
jgi:hypothetical protein